ncbi:hypothetical protein EPA93_39575 [Ktedonosporobacter rubrisoli]|uniref:Uncharacterized protein n=1 Tax=Ktedonosporobacter rubrisoli TaxID=2509675 RepID=A0A4P6K223_KTERU|nr:hypothetical protein [Ktedonosporobacter rubrisoli]QBD81750.1 hypothetical protein EPA93_39575 [Ktedonosporobacter rubrisoli]
MKNSLYMLWFEGICPDRLQKVPSLVHLCKYGVDLRLTPFPLLEAGQCYYQLLTGTGAGKFGRFDAVYPELYRACPSTELPEGAVGRLLPDILHTYKLATLSLHADNVRMLDALQDQALDFALLRVRAADLSDDELDMYVERCLELVAPSGHLLVLTDVWSPAPHAFVNLNDFLAEIGLLEVGKPRTTESIAWPETLAYSLGNGQLWINLRGREKQGTVNAGQEYQDVCSALIREICDNWLDPRTQKPVVEKVLRKDEIFIGDYLFKAPDLIVIYKPGYAASARAQALDFDGASVLAQSEPEEQTACEPYARLIGSGPALVSSFAAEARLVDILPSALYMLDQAIPRRIDGSIISSMFTLAYLQQTAVRYIDDEANMLSDEEEGLIVDRLRDLGYLG